MAIVRATTKTPQRGARRMAGIIVVVFLVGVDRVVGRSCAQNEWSKLMSRFRSNIVR